MDTNHAHNSLPLCHASCEYAEYAAAVLTKGKHSAEGQVRQLALDPGRRLSLCLPLRPDRLVVHNPPLLAEVDSRFPIRYEAGK